jgi:hypothetical protein
MDDAAYALAAGAGTQVFTQAFAEGVGGDGELSSGLSLGAGWVINLAVAELVIGRRRVAPLRPPSSWSGPDGEVGLRASGKPRVRIECHLDGHWFVSSDDLEVEHQDDATTTLIGVVQDQAQLHGPAREPRDLGVTLLQLNVVEEPVSD